jgi:hypothetical protein
MPRVSRRLYYTIAIFQPVEARWDFYIFLKGAEDPPADVPHHVAVSRLHRRHGAVVGVRPPTFYAAGHGWAATL